MDSEMLRKKLTLGCAFIIVTSSSALAAPGKPMSDQWVSGRIQGALSYNTYLDSSDLSVDYRGGDAVLTGVVSSETERELAEQIAANVDGVATVDNQIKVDPEIAVRNRPDWIQRGIDATTTAAVKTRLLNNKSMHDMDIRIETKDSIVGLSGTVSSQEQKQRAEVIALNTRDVRDVKNDLLVSAPSTEGETKTSASADLSRRISDSWITSKIRSALYFSSDFPGSSVSVQTVNHKVTLEGHARSSAQRADIGAMVNDFLGVTGVDNLLVVKSSSFPY